MSSGIRIKLRDNIYISLIQVSIHEKNNLGVSGIREKGSIEAAMINVDEEGNSKGIIGKVIGLNDAKELIEFINDHIHYFKAS